nr:hypothetical protein [uncultured Flavobacterium sp.]
MKKHIFISLITLSFINSFSQEKNANFVKYQAIDYLLIFNPNSNKNAYFDGNTGKMSEPSKFVLAGIGSQYEYGIMYNNWLKLGALSGIYANIYDSTYSIPIASSLTLAPKIGSETRIYGKFAYGWNTAIGRGNKNGKFTNYQFGIEFESDTKIFIFATNHNFVIKNQNYSTIGIGFGGILF